MRAAASLLCLLACAHAPPRRQLPPGRIDLDLSAVTLDTQDRALSPVTVKGWIARGLAPSMAGPGDHPLRASFKADVAIAVDLGRLPPDATRPRIAGPAETARIWRLAALRADVDLELNIGGVVFAGRGTGASDCSILEFTPRRCAEDAVERAVADALPRLRAR